MSNLIGVRVAGVVIHENAILLHTSDKDDFWVFPGGGCKLHETTIEALEREIYEEIQTEIEVKDLIWVIENFYEYGKEKYHGIEFYYRIEFRESNHFYDRENFMGYEKENDTSLLFQWHDINEVDDIVIYPKSLKKLIKDIPSISGVQHIINNDLSKKNKLPWYEGDADISESIPGYLIRHVGGDKFHKWLEETDPHYQVFETFM